MPDAVLIFPQVGRIGLDAALEAIGAENEAGRYWAEVAFEQPALRTPAPDVALLVYRATARWNDAAEPERVHCATVYVQWNGRRSFLDQ